MRGFFLLATFYLPLCTGVNLPSTDIMSTLHEELNVEILLLSSPNASLNLERMHEESFLPNLHYSSEKMASLILLHDCPATGVQPEGMHFMSSLPWRAKSKSALTWLIPEDSQSLIEMIAALEK